MVRLLGQLDAAAGAAARRVVRAAGARVVAGAGLAGVPLAQVLPEGGQHGKAGADEADADFRDAVGCVSAASLRAG